MANTRPQNIKTIKDFYSSYPGSMERYILLEKTVTEINIKKHHVIVAHRLIYKKPKVSDQI